MSCWLKRQGELAAMVEVAAAAGSCGECGADIAAGNMDEGVREAFGLNCCD